MSRRLPPALAVTAVSLRRLLRDRTSMFFIVILPVLIILILGVTIQGSGRLRVGVTGPAGTPLADRLVAAFKASSALTVTSYDSLDSARTALRRAELDGVVALPARYDARLRGGERVALDVYVQRAGSSGQATASAVAAVVTHEAAIALAAGFVADRVGGSFAAGLEAAQTAAGRTPSVGVATRVVDSRSDILPEGFSYSAPTMLVLFVFVNALAGGAAIIQVRGLGIYGRALAAPVRVGAIIAGETLAYLAMSLLQSALIIGIGALVFGVSWGNPLAAATLVGLWALVGTGAGVLSGTLFRTPEQASAIGPAVGIAAGMLGGCMWPLAIVPDAMRTLGHLTPQAWAVDAWTALLSRGDGLAGIAQQLAVLVGFAVVLLALAAARLRRALIA